MLAGLGLAGLGAAMLPMVRKAAASRLFEELTSDAGACPFRLAVINDQMPGVIDSFASMRGVLAGMGYANRG